MQCVNLDILAVPTPGVPMVRELETKKIEPPTLQVLLVSVEISMFPRFTPEVL